MMTEQNLPIGVFDSGVGGLTVLRSLQEALPNEDFIYLGDTARLPYGTKSKETVTNYSLQACKILIKRGIKALVVACNTASTLALPELIKQLNHIPIIGVLEPGATAAVAATNNGKIAVIATESTVKAGGYQQHILNLLPDADIATRSCPLFVALAEEGWVTGDIATAVARRYLQDLINKHNPDTLVLGCTHFPALLPTIKDVVGDKVNIIDSAHTTATQVREILNEKNLLKTLKSNSKTHFLVTDSPHRFHDVAKRFLNADIDESQIELVDGSLK